MPNLLPPEMDTSETPETLLLSNISTDVKRLVTVAEELHEFGARREHTNAMGQAIAGRLEALIKSTDEVARLVKMAMDNARTGRLSDAVLARGLQKTHSEKLEWIAGELAELKGIAMTSAPVVGGKPLEIKAKVDPRGRLVATATYPNVDGKDVDYTLIRTDLLTRAWGIAKPGVWHVAVVVGGLAAAAIARWGHEIVGWFKHLGGK